MKGVTLIIALIQMNCWGQNDSIIDHRDNEKYAVVNIGNSIWFLDYLRYKSENAFFNTDTDKLERIEVNYYPNSELKTACPTGWQIETMFKALKSSGFNIEKTHLQDIERIEKLVALVFVAFVWCYKVGIYIDQFEQKVFSNTD